MGRKRREKKTKPGDGSPLRPFRPWQALYRSLFYLDADTTAGRVDQFAVDVDYFDWDSRVFLYRDGKQEALAGLPAAFPVPGGVIEVATSTYGLRRMHLVDSEGTARVLRPHPHSAEGWRARLARRHPRTSKAVSAASVAVLLASLLLLVPQMLEWVTHLPEVAEVVGTVDSPVALPAWVNSALVVAGVLAAVERALNLRNHWLLDADTGWLGTLID